MFYDKLLENHFLKIYAKQIQCLFFKPSWFMQRNHSEVILFSGIKYWRIFIILGGTSFIAAIGTFPFRNLCPFTKVNLKPGVKGF